MESEAELSPLPRSDESKRKARGPSSRRRKLILIALTIAIIGTPFGFLAWDYSVCPVILVVPGQTSVAIPAGNHVAYPFNVTKVLDGNREIFGTLTSEGAVILYVTTSQQLSYWNSTGPSGPYEFTSGPVTSLDYHQCGGKGTYCAYLPPTAPLGPDDLVLRNPGQATISVVIGRAMVVGPC